MGGGGGGGGEATTIPMTVKWWLRVYRKVTVIGILFDCHNVHICVYHLINSDDALSFSCFGVDM